MNAIAETEKKNYAKRDSYALAFSLIKDAIDNCYPLQAITIEESILADRIWSTLNVGMKKQPKVKQQRVGTLGAALKQWHPEGNDKKVGEKASPHPNAKLFDGYMDELYPILEDWWDARNNALHGISKSSQGEGPNLCAEDFVANAQFVAEVGLLLTRQVCNWSQKQIRRAKRVLSKKNSINQKGETK